MSTPPVAVSFCSAHPVPSFVDLVWLFTLPHRISSVTASFLGLSSSPTFGPSPYNLLDSSFTHLSGREMFSHNAKPANLIEPRERLDAIKQKIDTREAYPNDRITISNLGSYIMSKGLYRNYKNRQNSGRLTRVNVNQNLQVSDAVTDPSSLFETLFRIGQLSSRTAFFGAQAGTGWYGPSNFAEDTNTETSATGRGIQSERTIKHIWEQEGIKVSCDLDFRAALKAAFELGVNKVRKSRNRSTTEKIYIDFERYLEPLDFSHFMAYSHPYRFGAFLPDAVEVEMTCTPIFVNNNTQQAYHFSATWHVLELKYKTLSQDARWNTGVPDNDSWKCQLWFCANFTALELGVPAAQFGSIRALPQVEVWVSRDHTSMNHLWKQVYQMTQAFDTLCRNWLFVSVPSTLRLMPLSEHQAYVDSVEWYRQRDEARAAQAAAQQPYGGFPGGSQGGYSTRGNFNNNGRYGGGFSLSKFMPGGRGGARVAVFKAAAVAV
ncbi:hypothetical protein T439DRAFT_351965 [Meredithblackwellia eburnea MCA 4105]